jgi:hypothetical protein
VVRATTEQLMTCDLADFHKFIDRPSQGDVVMQTITLRAAIESQRATTAANRAATWTMIMAVATGALAVAAFLGIIFE